MDSKALMIGGGIIGLVILVILWQARKDVIALGGVVGDVGTAVNPLNDKNVFSETVNKVGSIAAGDNTWTLGGWIYDATHTATMQP